MASTIRSCAHFGGESVLPQKKQRAIASVLLIVCVFAGIIADAGQRGLELKSGAVKEIRDVLDKQVEAWNRRDLEGFMQGYWDSPDLTFYSGGTTTSGWKQTIERYKMRYQSEGREMGTLTFSDLKIEVLGPKSAFVRGRWNLKMTNGEAGGLFTLIFRKMAGGWKIVHDHTSSTQ